MTAADKNTEEAYRLAVIRIGIGLTWVAVAAYAWFVSIAGGPTLDDRAAFIIAAAAATLVLTFLPWRWLLRRLLGDIVVLAWIASIALAGLALPELSEEQTSTFVLLGTAAFSTATLLAWPAAVSSVLIVLGGFIGAEISRTGGTRLIEAPRLGGFAFTLGVVVLDQVALARRVLTANNRLAAAEQAHMTLAAREAELDQIYSVSRTIGTGRDLADVLPELVGRVVNAVDARTGVVLLYDADRGELQLMSPIWSSGLPLRADQRRLRIDSPGIAQQAFKKAEPVIRSDAQLLGDTLLAELDENQIVAVPLNAGSEPIGVLLVGDTRDAAFDDTEVDTIQSLAGPAALVLNQLARYEEARAMSDRMTELAQLKTDFVSVVSHELRTPLTSIIGSLRTLQRPQLAPTTPDELVLLDTAARQADRLKALIEDLLVVSRIDNRALPVRPVQLDLRKSINDIVESIPGAAQFTRVSVDEEARQAVVDPEHLRRILINLIENALRYAPRKPIHVSVVRSAGEALIRVADEGQGIPAHYIDRIFERFTQVDRRSEGGRGGTGLGLSIVHGLAEAMGGRVWYEHAAYDTGAIFVVAIPLRAGTRRPAGV